MLLLKAFEELSQKVRTAIRADAHADVRGRMIQELDSTRVN
jgi:hypothetical protein